MRVFFSAIHNRKSKEPPMCAITFQQLSTIFIAAFISLVWQYSLTTYRCILWNCHQSSELNTLFARVLYISVLWWKLSHLQRRSVGRRLATKFVIPVAIELWNLFTIAEIVEASSGRHTLLSEMSIWWDCDLPGMLQIFIRINSAWWEK